ncbi:MAG: hypothetical protein ACRDRG_19385 [Pseudonocardiaceae bacterium]
MNGQMPLRGDSGAPFYAHSLGAAHIRGHIISGNPGTGKGFAQSYASVASTYGEVGDRRTFHGAILLTRGGATAACKDDGE